MLLFFFMTFCFSISLFVFVFFLSCFVVVFAFCFIVSLVLHFESFFAFGIKVSTLESFRYQWQLELPHADLSEGHNS